MAITKDDILETISNMSVMDVVELVKAMEEKFDVSAAAAVAAAPAAAGGAEGGAAEQTEFKVVMKSFGDSKINVIKAIRSITALPLKEAKDLVEGVPSTVKEGLAKDEAEKVKAELEAAGATAELE